MESTLRKSPLWLIAGLVGLLLISSIACSFSGVSIGSKSAVIDITLKENEVNRLIDNATTLDNDHDLDLLDKVTSVEMMDGFIRVHGTTRDASGATVEGSYDASFTTKDDILEVQVINVDIPGVELSDLRVAKVNQELKDGLTKSVTESNGEVLYKEAWVKDGELHLKIQVSYQDKQD